MSRADFSELDDLARDLRRIPTTVGQDVEAIVKRAAVNLKRDLQKDLRGSRHFKVVAPSVDFDVSVTAHVIQAEVGPDKARTVGSNSIQPGALANIAYFGTSRGGGTVRDPQLALDDEEPRFLDAMDKVLRNLL